MFRIRRLLPLLACAASACALSASSAFAAPPAAQGVVLSRTVHGVRLVAPDHRVGHARVAAAGDLRRGDVVTVRGGRARVTRHARTVTFLAQVVRSTARGATLRLGDGATFVVGGPPRRGRGASAAVDFQHLLRGQTLLVTLAADGDGNVALRIKVRATPAGGDGQSGADPGEGAADDEVYDEIDGTVTAIAPDASALTVDPDDDGGAATIAVEDPSLLEGIAVGDDVAVTLDDAGTAIDVELLSWDDGGEEWDDEG